MLLFLSVIILFGILFLVLYRMISMNNDMMIMQEVVLDSLTLEELNQLLRKEAFKDKINARHNESRSESVPQGDEEER